MSDAQDRGRWLIQGLRRGEPEAVELFVSRYGRSLEAVAKRDIQTRMGRRFDAPEVVQSVCRTFLRRVEGGEFELDDSESLWRLLCAITLTKVREKARFHLREKRSLAREVDPTSGPGEDDEPVDPLAFQQGDAPDPGAVAEFADTFRHVIEELDEEERVVVDMKLMERSNEEIAEALDCSDRTVRRLLGRLHQRFEELLGAS